MSAFFKAGPLVKTIIGNWNEHLGPGQLEEAIGCDAQCILHYQGGEVYLEMPNGATPKHCTPVTEGQFMPMISDE